MPEQEAARQETREERRRSRPFGVPVGPGVRRTLRLVGAFLLLNLLLMAPHWILEGGLGPRWIALEAGVLVGVASLLPRRRWSRALAGMLAVVLVAVVVVDLGDVMARRSLARPLNLYLDLHLLGAVHHLLRGTMGPWLAALSLGGAAVGVVVAVGVVGRVLTPPPSPGRWLGARSAAAVLATVSALALAAQRVPAFPSPPALAQRTAVPAFRVTTQQVQAVGRMLRERARFEGVMAASPASYEGRAALLAGLGGADVTLAFVESYGMSAVEDPRYAPVIRPRLQAMEEGLARAGLSLATGALVAPSQGGQSWLGHGSVLSGLWLSDQMRYDLLLARDRETLVDDFRRAGYRTAAVMPAITLAWPEGARFGYDRIWARADIDYAGPPLNWVTMPDQFTWSFLERTVRAADPGRPLFAELGLISSHAPWTPILPVLEDWDAVDDGAVFQRWADAGETPGELWKDVDRVREHYARSVEYALHAASSWAETFLGPDELLVLLGDHQPAPLVTGEGATRVVPVHVVSGDPALVAPFLEWGFRPGAFPPSSGDVPGMDDFRGWFVEAFSGPSGETRVAEPGLLRGGTP